MFIHQAIKNILNTNEHVDYYIQSNILYWTDINFTKPTEEEIDQEILRLQEEFNNIEYQRLRKAEYDKLNQDEMRFDDLVNGTTTWQDAIVAIKNKYPKEL